MFPDILFKLCLNSSANYVPLQLIGIKKNNYFSMIKIMAFKSVSYSNLYFKIIAQVDFTYSFISQKSIRSSFGNDTTVIHNISPAANA